LKDFVTIISDFVAILSDCVAIFSDVVALLLVPFHRNCSCLWVVDTPITTRAWVSMPR
jgi:hypothetical protein